MSAITSTPCRAVGDSIRRAEDDYATAPTDEPYRLSRFLGDAGFHHHVASAYTDLAAHQPEHAVTALSAATTSVADSRGHEYRARLIDQIPLVLNAYRTGNLGLAHHLTAAIS